jgi:hypothetical protein
MVEFNDRGFMQAFQPPGAGIGARAEYDRLRHGLGIDDRPEFD